jgi:hypothetical protein
MRRINCPCDCSWNKDDNMINELKGIIIYECPSCGSTIRVKKEVGK